MTVGIDDWHGKIQNFYTCVCATCDYTEYSGANSKRSEFMAHLTRTGWQKHGRLWVCWGCISESKK